MLNEPFIKFQLGSEARNNVFTNIMICCNIESHVFATSPLDNFWVSFPWEKQGDIWESFFFPDWHLHVIREIRWFNMISRYLNKRLQRVSYCQNLFSKWFNFHLFQNTRLKTDRIIIHLMNNSLGKRYLIQIYIDFCTWQH